jgi:hypothetical protein
MFFSPFSPFFSPRIRKDARAFFVLQEIPEKNLPEILHRNVQKILLRYLDR